MNVKKRRDPLVGLADDVERVRDLAHRPSKAKRNRAWECKNDDVVTYRAQGLKEVNVRVKRYAHRHDILVGEAAKLALEAGLAVLENKPQAEENRV